MTKNRPLFFSLAGCAAVCLILRVVLKLTAVDPATGFYEGGGALPLVFNILLGVSVLLLLAGRVPLRAEDARRVRHLHHPAPGARLCGGNLARRLGVSECGGDLGNPPRGPYPRFPTVV